MTVLLEVEVTDEEAEALARFHREETRPTDGLDLAGLIERLAEAAAT